MIRKSFERLGYSGSAEDRVSRLSDTAKLAGIAGDLHSTSDLTATQAARVLRQIRDLPDAQALMELLRDGQVPGE